MKKLISFVLSILFLFNTNINTFAQNKNEEFLKIVNEAGYNINPIYTPKTAILIDGNNGNILWEKDSNLKHDPASTSKIMTIYLVFEAIEKGELTLDTKIIATENDEKISKIRGLSNNKIVKNVAYPVEELIKMTLVPSSNVASIMLANKISHNDTDLFIDKMNQKAKELKMIDTYFTNASGAVASAFNGFYKLSRYNNEEPSQTTAKDLAILTYNTLKKYPEITKYTKNNIISTMENTPYEEKFVSYNHSLQNQKYAFNGVDGLKSGSSPSAGFNAVVTATQNNTNLIAVVMGVGNWYDRKGEYFRHIFLNSLLYKGFSEYENKKILNKGLNTVNDKEIVIENDVYDILQKNSPNNYKLVLNNGNIIVENNLSKIETLNQNNIKYIELSLKDKILNFIKKQNKIVVISISLAFVIIISILLKVIFTRK